MRLRLVKGSKVGIFADRANIFAATPSAIMQKAQLFFLKENMLHILFKNKHFTCTAKTLLAISVRL